MRRKTIIFIVVPGLLILLWMLSRPASGYTRLELADPETGSKLASFVLGDGERVVLTWRNSIWGLDVTEAFVAQGGLLIQTEVTFAHPDGSPPPRVAPEEVDDLYHVGGAFSAKGLARPIHRVVYRIGEIGNPRMRVRDRVIEFKPLVGFGGRIILTANRPHVYETLSRSGK